MLFVHLVHSMIFDWEQHKSLFVLFKDWLRDFGLFEHKGFVHSSRSFQLEFELNMMCNIFPAIIQFFEYIFPSFFLDCKNKK